MVDDNAIRYRQLVMSNEHERVLSVSAVGRVS